MKKHLGILAVVVTVALGLGACGEKKPAVDETKEKASAEMAAKEKEALDTGIEAYVYAYPLVTMEYTRRALTNTAAPEGTKAPMGQFVRMREYPNASFKDVTAPNADTLYTHGMVRRVQGAVGHQRPGHEGSLLFASNARRLDHGVRRPWQTHHRNRSADLRDHRAGLERHASRWGKGI